jgi:hypothetical protein
VCDIVTQIGKWGISKRDRKRERERVDREDETLGKRELERDK